MKSFKISIILPVYNVEKYLSQCLDSLVGQTLDAVEIVAVNDGSTDGSLRILEQYRRQYPERLSVYTTPNQGVSHARNYGFRKSQGEYVWFVDSDDFIEPNACERLYNTASANGNDLVLFSYFNVDAATGEKTPFPCGHYNRNFTFREKPYEMSILSPFPWIKLIRRDLFEGLAFPVGIRFEDLPVAYLLAAKAKNVGVVRECFYNYRKNAGFLARLTPATADIKKAVVYLQEQMEALGLRQTYQSELDFITIRHFFFRFWKLLTNYETGKKELKLSLIQELWDYIEENIPDWRENHYVKYTLPEHLYRMLYLYGDRQELIAFVEACDGMTEAAQKAWIKAYKKTKESEWTYNPESLRTSAIQAKEAYEAVREKQQPSPKLAFPSSIQGTTAEENPDSPQYGEALAQAGQLTTDMPLPWYFHKAPGQKHTLLCTGSLYPRTFSNSRNSSTDIGLWQHSMLTADLLVFPDEITRRLYMQETMLEGICRTKVQIIENIFSEEDFRSCENRQPVTPQTSGPQMPDDSRPILPHSDSSSYRQILCCPVMLGAGHKQALQARRSFISALYQLDWELTDNECLYLAAAKEDTIDCGEFRHIKPLPATWSLGDAARSCDAFLSDFHPLMLTLARQGKTAIRFLPADDTYEENPELDSYIESLGIPAGTNIPALAQLLRKTRSAAGQAREALSQAKGEVHTFAPSQRSRALLYSDRRINKKLVQAVNAFVSRYPDKEFWLAYNDFESADAAKALAGLVAGCHVLPIKAEPQKTFSAGLASALSRRLPVVPKALAREALPIGKKNFTRYLGSASFDEMFLLNADGIRSLGV